MIFLRAIVMIIQAILIVLGVFHDVSAWDMTAGTTVSEEYKSPVSFCPQILITYCWLSFGFLMRSQTAAVSTGFC
jgi:hypothetical protein